MGRGTLPLPLKPSSHSSTPEFALLATAGNDAPSETSVVRIGYNIINATGMFDVACREWRNKPDDAKNLPLFRRHYRDANQDRRHSTTTAGSAGYDGAHAAIAPSATVVPVKTPVSAAIAPAAPHRGPDLRRNTSYCWLHGFLKNQTNNSLTCKFKEDCHQDAATATNQLGGATGNFVLRSSSTPQTA